MKLQFIGTASAKTSLKRFHSSVLLKDKDQSILIDTGEAVTKALLSQYIYYNSIDSIIITHLHADHYSGLPALITQMHLDNRTEVLNIYADITLIENLQDFLYNSYIFLKRLSFQINFIATEVNVEFSVSENVKVVSINNSHLKKYSDFDVKKRLSFTSSSLLLNFGNNRIHYSGDIGGFSDLQLMDKFNPTLLIAETTHITFSEIQQLLPLPFPHKIILTHYSDEDIPELKKSILALPDEFEDKILLAEDGLTLNFQV